MAFASADDVATRLFRELTEGEEDAAELTIAVVSGLIAGVVGEGEAWIDTFGEEEDETPVPALYRALCIEKAVSVFANPLNVAQASETLGAYSYSQTFPRAQDLGIFLSAEEQREIRRVYYGGATRSATLVTPYSGDDTSILDFPWPLPSP